MCDGATWRNIRNNEKIAKTVFALSNGQASVNDGRLRQFILDEVGLDVMVNDKRYVDENGQTVRFMPKNTFVMFPDGALGRT